MHAAKDNTGQALPSAPARNASLFARIGLLMYTMLIVYASLYPFSNWHSLGLPFWAFLFQPLPHYWTMFDALANVIGYMPFGALAVFALYPRARGVISVVLATLGGILLSLLMESIQTYLPSRVSSNLDLITNGSGAFLGALAGLRLTRTFLEESRLLDLRKRWLYPEAGRGLIVVALWLLAQIFPLSYLFGHGQILPVISGWAGRWLGAPVDLGNMLRDGMELSAQDYWLAETIITACGLTGAVLAASCLLRKAAPRAWLLPTLVLGAVAVKSMATALIFDPDDAFIWLTPGAKGGLLVGAMMLAGLIFAPHAAQRRLSIASLLLSVIAVNYAPANPYFLSTMQAWPLGKFLNFYGAAQFLALCWPLFAIWLLLRPVDRLKGK
jgi:VanZ family protein